uniref:TerD domain-containing protein n=1 Tax=Magnetococcus massalia (strain MO-1) TaxID=451514 RepID=A0A1S7LGG2_MAGMO|nr:Conserved protein of unknown function. Putative stress protein [Candidatus Magnetococcus massalia]
MTATQLQLDQDFFLADATETEVVDVWFRWEKDDAQLNAALDMDFCAVMLGVEERMLDDGHLIYYNNAHSPCHSVTHLGDDQAQDQQGAEECLRFKLHTVPEEIVQILLCATIPADDMDKHHLGMLQRAWFELVAANEAYHPMAQREMFPGGEQQYGWIVGIFYRQELDNAESQWVFRHVKEELPDGMQTLLDHFSPSGDY